MELQQLTEKLSNELDTLLTYYETHEPPQDLRDKTFFLFVKEVTNPIYELLEDWEEKALDFVKQHKKNLHPHQIVSTKENMELLLMHTYYIDVKRKRYMELNFSVHYVFGILLEELEEKDC